MKRFAVLASMLSLAVVLAGCDFGVFDGTKKVQARYRPEGKQMLIVPFRDPAFDYFENNSPHNEGVLIAALTAKYIRDNDITPVVDGYSSQPIATAYEDNKDDLLDSLKAMAKVSNCDLVLMGKIEPVYGRDGFYLGGSSTNLIRAAMHLSVRLYDMSMGGRTVWNMEENLAFPEGNEYEFGVPVGELKRQDLMKGITALAAQKIGRAFHDHKEPR